MDKENLYYLVTKGTNNRGLILSKGPLILESDAADFDLKAYGGNREKISIADFEEKFKDEETE